MGNHRFRLSDMMPNAWFYKLKEMGTKPRSSKISPQSTASKKPLFSQPRRYYSYNLSTDPNRVVDKFCNSRSPINLKVSDLPFPEENSRKLSPMKKSERKSLYKPSPKFVSSSSVFSHRNSFNTLSCTDNYHDQYDDALFFSDPFDQRLSFCNCRISSSSSDIIIDVNMKSSSTKIETFHDFDSISELKFPQTLKTPQKISRLTTKKVTKIRTRSTKTEYNPDLNCVLARNSSVNSNTGIKLRTNVLKISSKNIQRYGRRRRKSSSKSMEYSESYAIVKCSDDPERDFKESMMEMITENNIRSSKELEDLLACYLLLNLDEYHDLIVKVFEQIWFAMK